MVDRIARLPECPPVVGTPAVSFKVFFSDYTQFASIIDLATAIELSSAEEAIDCILVYGDFDSFEELARFRSVLLSAGVRVSPLLDLR